MIKNPKRVYSKLPETPGVYFMKNRSGKILYAGKAGNLRRRVASYFLKPQEYRIEKLLGETARIDFQKTGTAIEALILEAELIKKNLPPFNVREKDDKSFLHVEITKEKFPRVLLVRGKDTPDGKRFGPFTSAKSIREALKIIRKIFPWSVHPANKIGKFSRPCFEKEIGLCPGTCTGETDRKEYLKNIKKIKLFFEGKKHLIIKTLEREMKEAAKKTEYEKAAKLKNRLFSLRHIQDVALLEQTPVFGNGIKNRIEGYDISNISGKDATGSMVVFVDDKPAKGEYRKFRIKTVTASDDTGMLKEVIRRRLGNDWTLPNLILIDGGIGQVNAAKEVLDEVGLLIPVVGIAKGPKRKKNILIGKMPEGVSRGTLTKVRDEAHRFAISYHRNLRGRNFLDR